MDYPFYPVPLAEFITDAFEFFEKHENCDTERVYSPAYTADEALERARQRPKAPPKAATE